MRPEPDSIPEPASLAYLALHYRPPASEFDDTLRRAILLSELRLFIVAPANAAVIAIVSSSQLSPPVTHRTSISGMDGVFRSERSAVFMRGRDSFQRGP
jgi:hypothetical protein